ncbi:hypothetical protein [Pedobacter punctiformis]|uniref:Coproporphyrinogen III oxidase n=1 Tax=Pedobacter punctiformis TaxID=3004097 RepID=A0ABT4L804_9SPHI|nr:hypothetical protein [Pedobacter sp. HCMS5-2]MCZ4244048.1 hypothetical protein [Pedobacter sp. HCMS5-2]
MKNAFKLGFLALALSLSVVACNSEKKAEGSDTTLTDSSTIITDTNKVDTTVKTDTSKKDTTVKTTTTTTEVKH